MEGVLLVTVVPDRAGTVLMAAAESDFIPDESEVNADSSGAIPDLFSSCIAVAVSATVPEFWISVSFPCFPGGAVPGALHPQKASKMQRIRIPQKDRLIYSSCASGYMKSLPDYLIKKD
jgi:hypothetical protein